MNEGACLRYIMNRIRQVRGACLRYVMNRDRQMSGGGGGGWGLRHPPTPTPLFEAVQGCLKASGLKFWLTPIMRALCLQIGGGLRPPRCFKPCKLASKHVSVLGSYHASILLAKGGWAAPPLLSSASLLQST